MRRQPAMTWNWMPNRKMGLDRDAEFTGHLLRGAGGSFALKAAATLLSLAGGVVLARALGATRYGVYAYAFAWLELLKVPATLGLPILVTRTVAVCHASNDWGRMRGLLVRANQAVLGISLVLMLLAGGAGWVLVDRVQHPGILATLWLALLLLPLSGLAGLRSACLCGLQWVVLGQVPDAVIRPVAFLILLGGAWLLGAGLTSELAMTLQVAAVAVAFSSGAVLLLGRLPPPVKQAVPVFDTRVWARAALPFLFAHGLALVNGQTDLIMLGWFTSAADVGIYRVVSLGAGFVAFPIAVSLSVLGPYVARLHAEGKAAQLQVIITLSARATLVLALPVAAAILLFGNNILLHVFGPEYQPGGTALIILAVAQLFHAGVGMAGVTLDMTGHQNDTAKGFAVAAVLNVVLNAFLIPLWGIEGAAIATAVSLATWTVLLALLVARRLGLDATALARLPAMPTLAGRA